MKKKSIITKIVLFNLILIIIGCKSSSETKLEECLSVTGVLFKGTHRSGYAYGEALIKLEKDGSFCRVDYSALGYNAVEDGKLTNFELKQKSSNNTYEIIADWNADGSSNGAKFSFEIIDDEKPNTIRCQITGAGFTDDGRPSWVHFSNLTLSDEKFQKIKTILSMNNKSMDNVIDKKKVETKNSQPKVSKSRKQKEVKSSKNETNKIIAKFINYEWIENDNYVFVDENGKEYYFTDVPDKYNLIGEEGPNKLYVNKKFNIEWTTVNGEYEYPINKIIKIELIK